MPTILTRDELSLTDLADRAGLAYPTAHREAARLLDAGILTERHVGRTRLIRADDDSPLVEPLRQILLVVSGPVVLLAGALRDIEGVESALLYGSFAARLRGIRGPAPQDVDLMIVGTPDPDEVYAACDRVQDAVGRPVNPTILTREEVSEGSGFTSPRWRTARSSRSSGRCRGEFPAGCRADASRWMSGRCPSGVSRRCPPTRPGRRHSSTSPLAPSRTSATCGSRRTATTSPTTRAHAVGEALLARHGYRTTNAAGQHEAPRPVPPDRPRLASRGRGCAARRPDAPDTQPDALRGAYCQRH